jgi:hypothetical protein
VLSREEDEVFVVSDLILDARQRYNEYYEGLVDGHYASNYKESEIRAWLNGEFLSSAFPSGDKRILTTEVDNSAATTDSSSNPYSCDNTQDKVFLLSYQDYINATYGFSGAASKGCRTTDWARARGAFSYSSSRYLNNGDYWTRSPDSSRSNHAWYVCFDGYFDVGAYVHVEGTCVRPALRVKVA